MAQRRSSQDSARLVFLVVLQLVSELRALAALLDERLAQHIAAIDPATPAHRVEFSPRITESWALIYYRRNLVRLSPYLFLLEGRELKHGSHWRELDATLRHEAAHACVFHRCGHTGHGPPFHDAIARLGLRANGACDLGPENMAYRYLYACATCNATWPRRAPIRGNVSCGECSPGRYSPDHRLVLREHRDLCDALRRARPVIGDTIEEGVAAMRVERVAPRSSLPLPV